MFRSVVRLIPSFGGRFASTMVARPTVVSSSTPLIFQLKQNVQFAQPTQAFHPFGVRQQVLEKIDPISESNANEMIMTSVLRKRRLKMKKHKLRKRRKAQRALRIRIGK
jgi:hypothetical protein